MGSKDQKRPAGTATRLQPQPQTRRKAQNPPSGGGFQPSHNEWRLEVKTCAVSSSLAGGGKQPAATRGASRGAVQPGG
eukprot:7560046-Pyramimonas_sp.AAC.1